MSVLHWDGGEGNIGIRRESQWEDHRRLYESSEAAFGGSRARYDDLRGEQIAGWAAKARVVKAFNMTGSKNMENPRYGADKVSMLICGDDADAQRVVSRLAVELGFEVFDAGGLVAAPYLEPLAMSWVRMAYTAGYGRDFAFKVLRR